ncbi:hypothetical protein CPB83DRAFT_257125 [Crepidotus variabilis]|uniref:Uncharacterized protein n=1 Tax=Crepidotus variabilis TaxID=179855 RepID=A0A9P6JQT1_9AGAR|nr:hypothetical protein CPB83DRAFT_257125 [Crepidotus variabilis]
MPYRRLFLTPLFPTRPLSLVHIIIHIPVSLVVSYLNSNAVTEALTKTGTYQARNKWTAWVKQVLPVLFFTCCFAFIRRDVRVALTHHAHRFCDLASPPAISYLLRARRVCASPKPEARLFSSSQEIMVFV